MKVVYMTNNELYHYGVIGMKWGVRRRRTSPGTYTKKGVEVFDKKLAVYESANQNAKNLKKGGDKNAYLSAKRDRKAAKKELNRSYKQVKKDYNADKGKELYSKGKTITGNTTVSSVARMSAFAGSMVANQIIRKKMGNTKTSLITTTAVTLGSTAVGAIIAGKADSDNKKLRAYYSHSRDVR